MRFYSVKFILLLGFISQVGSNLADEHEDRNSVNTRGPPPTIASTNTRAQNVSTVSLRPVTTTPKYVLEFLSTLIEKLTDAIGKRFIVFDVQDDTVIKDVISLIKDSGHCVHSDTNFECKMSDSSMSVHIVMNKPHMYVSVNLHPDTAVSPMEDITNFCQEKVPQTTNPVQECPKNCSIKPTTCPTTTCPTTTCPTTTCPTCPTTTCAIKPTLACSSCRSRCLTKPTIQELCTTHYISSTTDEPMKTDQSTTANSQGSPCELKEQKTQQAECGGLLPIIVGCIVSFIAGVGICLLALCLIGHFRGRLCLNFTNSNKDVGNTGKSPGETAYTSPQLKAKGGTSNKEHEYLDLQAVESQYPTVARTPDGQNKLTGTAQLPMYETITRDANAHVYNGLERDSGSHTANLYDQTSPNRSSEHVYNGIQDDRMPSGSSALQQKASSGNAHVVQPYVNLELKQNLANQGLETDENMTQQNDYFILAKEEHPNNNLDLELDTQHEVADNPDDHEDYHSYHTLEKI